MNYGVYPQGVIYNSRNGKKSGEFILRAKTLVRLSYGFIQGVAAGLIGFAVIFLIFSFFPILQQEILYRTGQKQIKIVKTGFGDLIKTAEAQRIKNEAQTYGVDSYFSLVIPKIGAASNIVANVDSGKEDEYSAALKKGVAHAKGTYFPGQGKTVYLFAHSTDSEFNATLYNAVFYLLNKMEADDQIMVYFLDKKYIYKVKEKLIVPPTDTSWFNPGESERLILQTCYPPGTTWQRLLVIAEKT